MDRYKDHGLYGHKDKDFILDDREVFMKVIYVPSGRAKEYCELALNIYTGCNYQCLYCYAPRVIHRTVEVFRQVFPRKQILSLVREQANMYVGKKVLMNFISDPYPEIEKEYELTRKIIEVFVRLGVIPAILTKSNFADRDFDLLAKGNGYYGATLTFADPEKSRKWEKNAGLPIERIENLQKAHGMGIKTWVSLEPVISPKETLELIDLTYSFVDEYKVGKLNYMPEAERIDWSAFHFDVVKKLKEHKKEFYIKEDLRKFARGNILK